MDWQTILTIVTTIATLVLAPLCSYFLSEIKDLRRQNEDRKEEIAKIRENFATQLHLRDTEDRITNYIDTRFNDIGYKIDHVADMLMRFLDKAQK